MRRWSKDQPTIRVARAGDSSWPLIVDLEDVAEGPHPSKAVTSYRKIVAHDHRVAQARAESKSSTDFEIAEIECRLARNDLDRVCENRHIHAAKHVPAMFDAHEHTVIVVIAIPPESSQGTVSSESGHEEHRNELTLVLERERRRCAERNHAGLVVVRQEMLELD